VEKQDGGCVASKGLLENSQKAASEGALEAGRDAGAPAGAPRGGSGAAI
jgi:hypothetical protein